MRKFLTILLMVLSINCFSQDHLKFMGLSMGVDLETMCHQLKQKGFYKFSKYGTMCICQGQFYGEEAYVSIIPHRTSSMLSAIMINFMDSQWDSDKKEQVLNSLKSDLAKKYPDFVTKKENITYKVQDGQILLSVQGDKKVVLTYLNGYAKNKEEDL